MQHETFRGRDLRSVIAWVEWEMGDDAMILSTNVIDRPTGKVYEIVATRPEHLAQQRRARADGPISARLAQRPGRRPYVIALVGPPGAGKTTAAMKVALHRRGLEGRDIGILTLDTYRVAAVEEMQTYAELAGVPLEVVYHPREVPAAMERLGHKEAIVVDTPGREASGSAWVQALRELKADEVHLVLPATLRLDVARDLKKRLAAAGITHVLFTRVDEVPGDPRLDSMADALDLPVRWVGEGYEVPGRLIPAASGVLAGAGAGGSGRTTNDLRSQR